MSIRFNKDEIKYLKKDLIVKKTLGLVSAHFYVPKHFACS